MEIRRFSARLVSADKQVAAVSGRIGDFIFRTFKNGRIFAFYAPKNGSKTSRYRANYESISNQLREITASLRLEIVVVNFEKDEP